MPLHEPPSDIGTYSLKNTEVGLVLPCRSLARAVEALQNPFAGEAVRVLWSEM